MASDGETSGESSGRRTDGERLAIVTEAFEDGNRVSEIAERRGVSTASIYLWRRQLRDAPTGGARKVSGRRSPSPPRAPSPVTFAPVRIASQAQAQAPAPTRVEQIEIAFANGRVLKVCEAIDPVRLAALVAALECGAS